MLVVHPTSQCDICLDGYTWSTPTKAPHAIQCGHIFCYDCLRTVNPSNCPMCRKAFNPERIKKLHVDKAPSDGQLSSSPRSEENDFMRRVGALFAEGTADGDINNLVKEVTDWLNRHAGPLHQPLRHAIFALHQYKDLQRQHERDEETIARLRATHDRHAHVKQRDLDIAMKVESNILEEQEKIRAEYEIKVAALEADLCKVRSDHTRLTIELERYTSTANPLPRPPEITPLVASLSREHASANGRPAQQGAVSLGLGVASTATEPIQSRSSSGSSRGRAPSVHFADPPSSKEQPQGKYKVTANGEELRQENTRRPHLVVPGAPASQKVVPPRLTNLDGDNDVTPRPSGVVPAPAPAPPRYTRPVWPPHLMQYAPKDTSPCVWVGDPDEPHEILPTEVPLATFLQQQQARASTGTSTTRPPAETGSARMRVASAEAPMSGASPLDWQPGPAHKPGYVVAYYPAVGLQWIPEETAAKLPVRARGTESRYPYALAKAPSEVDEEWRKMNNGASPLPNPLQLSGVPEVPVAGPSKSVVHRGQYDPLPRESTAISALLFTSQDTSDRASSNSSTASLNGMGILAPPANSSSRTAVLTRTANDDLGLNLASLPGPSAEDDPSPALSWGTIPSRSSRNSSLGNLHLNNLPSPHPFAHSSESLERLPIGELNGGPIVLTEALTPRQVPSLFGDTRSSAGFSVSSSSTSSHPRDGGVTGLLLAPTSGASRSRQVVSSLRDLEDVNRSLSQLSDSQAQDPVRSEPSRSSRPSNRHSRQPSVSGNDPDAMVGPRTGITLYSARAPAQHPGSRSSNDPSPDGPSAPAQSRPRSGASVHSHAESNYSSHSEQSVHSAHSAASQPSHEDRRRRRGSVASALDFGVDREPVAMWTQPSDAQFNTSSHGLYGADSRSQKSQDSIPRAMDGLGSGPGSLSSLLLSFDPPSTSSAVTGNGEAAAGIHAPRPVNGRRSSMFGLAWSARAGH